MLRLNSDSTGTGKLTSEATSKEIQREYIKSGEIIKTKDWEVKISEVKFGQRINPSIQPMFYTYYQVKDTSNTYLCVILEAKNNSTLELGADKVATVKTKYNNKYTYTSFSAIEDANLGFTYTNITNIKPLTSRNIYYLAEMPKTIEGETNTPIELEIKIDNATYYYKVR